MYMYIDDQKIFCMSHLGFVSEVCVLGCGDVWFGVYILLLLSCSIHNASLGPLCLTLLQRKSYVNSRCCENP